MTIKQIIIEYLTQSGPSWGGTIDDYVRSVYGPKASNVSRRCRELVNEGRLDVCYKQVNGKGPKVARYRIHSEVVISIPFPKLEEQKFNL